MYKNPTSIDLQLGSALRFWRELDGITKADAARKAKVCRPMYASWELAHKAPSLGNFLIVAEALNVSPYMLALTMEAFESNPSLDQTYSI